MHDPKLPLVYSCSGCSNVAQLANTLAVRLDRAGLAEMSCIAGVGGRVASLVSKANSGRPILAIDGCPLQCVRGCLDQHGVKTNDADSIGCKVSRYQAVNQCDCVLVRREFSKDMPGWNLRT